MRRMGGDWLWIQAGPGSERAWSWPGTMERRSMGKMDWRSNPGSKDYWSRYWQERAGKIDSGAQRGGC